MNALPLFTDLPDRAAHVVPPCDATLSLTLYQDDQVKVILLALAAGQELYERASSVPSFLQQIKGDAQWRVNNHTITAHPGAWTHLPADLPHAIIAKTSSIMLLTLLKPQKTPIRDN